MSEEMVFPFWKLLTSFISVNVEAKPWRELLNPSLQVEAHLSRYGPYRWSEMAFCAENIPGEPTSRRTLAGGIRAELVQINHRSAARRCCLPVRWASLFLPRVTFLRTPKHWISHTLPAINAPSARTPSNSSVRFLLNDIMEIKAVFHD